MLKKINLYPRNSESKEPLKGLINIERISTAYIDDNDESRVNITMMNGEKWIAVCSLEELERDSIW